MSGRTKLGGLRARIGEKPASQGRGRVFMLSLGLFGVVVLLLMALIGYNAPNSIPGRPYYNLKAQFNEADNLTGHSQVRVSGKLVGQVLRPKVEHGKAVVDLQMEPSVKNLPVDSTIEVRPRSPVGVRYVDIRPGTSKKTLADGDTIPASQTKITRPLDEAFSTFDAPTRRNSQYFFRELGTGFAARGQDLNDAIGEFPHMLHGTRSVLGAIARRKGATRSFIRGAGVASDTYDPVREPLANGFRPEADALRPFSDAGQSVKDTLDTAPPAETTVTTRLPTVDRFTYELEGFASRIRPGLRAAPAAFTQTSGLMRESRPGLRGLTKTLYTGRRAAKPTLRLLRNVRPVLPNLESTLGQATKPVKSLGRYGCDFTRMGRFWTSMLGRGDPVDGGALRFNIVGGTLLGVNPKLLPPGLGPDANLQNPYPKPCIAGSEKPGQPIPSDGPR